MNAVYQYLCGFKNSFLWEVCSGASGWAMWYLAVRQYSLPLHVPAPARGVHFLCVLAVFSVVAVFSSLAFLTGKWCCCIMVRQFLKIVSKEHIYLYLKGFH